MKVCWILEFNCYYSWRLRLNVYFMLGIWYELGFYEIGIFIIFLDEFEIEKDLFV